MFLIVFLKLWPVLYCSKLIDKNKISLQLTRNKNNFVIYITVNTDNRKSWNTKNSHDFEIIYKL